MIINNVTRRTFLDLGSKFLAFIPMAHIIGCIPERNSKLSPENALKKLIFVIGPWNEKDILIAEDFVKRFFKAPYVIGQYLPESANLIQNLAVRFPDNTMAVETIDLKNLPVKEQEFLIALGKGLYSLVEVRFFVAAIPPWGQCQGSSQWQTQVPKFTS